MNKGIWSGGNMIVTRERWYKVKFTLEQDTKAQRGYTSTLSLTSALDGVGGRRHAPAALPPGKTRYPLYRTQGGPHSRSGRVRKISPPQGFDPRTVQRVVIPTELSRPPGTLKYSEKIASKCHPVHNKFHTQ